MNFVASERDFQDWWQKAIMCFSKSALCFVQNPEAEAKWGSPEREAVSDFFLPVNVFPGDLNPEGLAEKRSSFGYSSIQGLNWTEAHIDRNQAYLFERRNAWDRVVEGVVGSIVGDAKRLATEGIFNPDPYRGMTLGSTVRHYEMSPGRDAVLYKSRGVFAPKDVLVIHPNDDGIMVINKGSLEEVDQLGVA